MKKRIWPSCKLKQLSNDRQHLKQYVIGRTGHQLLTQHMSFDDVKCFGSPRTSQIPRSGSGQSAIAASTCWTQERPHAFRQVVARLGVQIDGVEHRPPHVVLVLRVGAVADPDRARVLVAGQVVEGLFGEPARPSMPYMIWSWPCSASATSATK